MKLTLSVDDLYFLCEWLSIVAESDPDKDKIINIINGFFEEEDGNNEPYTSRTPKKKKKITKRSLWIMTDCVDIAMKYNTTSPYEAEQLEKIYDKLIAINK